MQKGHFVASGYMGYIETQANYQLFATESDYGEYLNEQESEVPTK